MTNGNDTAVVRRSVAVLECDAVPDSVGVAYGDLVVVDLVGNDLVDVVVVGVVDQGADVVFDYLVVDGCATVGLRMEKPLFHVLPCFGYQSQFQTMLAATRRPVHVPKVSGSETGPGVPSESCHDDQHEQGIVAAGVADAFVDHTYWAYDWSSPCYCSVDSPVVAVLTVQHWIVIHRWSCCSSLWYLPFLKPVSSVANPFVRLNPMREHRAEWLCHRPYLRRYIDVAVELKQPAECPCCWSL